jgi:class 3 adenylate cyclase
VRISINTGFCTAGNDGSEERLDYTIVSGQMNVTSCPDQILLSHGTYTLVKDLIYCQQTGEITVKGTTHPLKTY